MNRRLFLAPAMALLAAVAGCGAAPGSSAAADAALAFLRAHRDGDGAAACALLTPDAADDVARSTGSDCAAAITGDDLPAPGAVTDVTVDGQWAKVDVATDAGDGTVFLAKFPGGWRIAAAGCRPRGERPYDCTIHGG